MSDALNNFHRSIESMHLTADRSCGIANLAIRDGSDPSEISRKLRQASEHILDLAKKYEKPVNLNPYYDSLPENDFRLPASTLADRKYHHNGG